ncbi:hypothetical protein ACYULU_08570 [Breznakiellaceae bacterium SP9]
MKNNALNNVDEVEIAEERAKLWERLMELRNEAIAQGMKLHTCDEVLEAIADERAGGEGLVRLWR